MANVSPIRVARTFVKMFRMFKECLALNFYRQSKGDLLSFEDRLWRRSSDVEYLIILFVRAILINFGIWECGEYSKNTFHVFLLQRRIFWDFDLKGQRILAWSLPGYDIWAAKLKISRDISGKTNQSVERYNKKRLFLKYWLLLIKHPNRQWAISRMNSRIFQRYFPLRYSGDFSNKIS